jgi:hypothetical protein
VVVAARSAQIQASPDTAEKVSPDTFGPNSLVQPSRDHRSLDVIRTLDFKTEVERAKGLAQAEGLESVKLKLNGVEIAVKSDQQFEAARQEFLAVAGKRRASGYDITSRGSGILEDRVYTAVLAAKLLEPECSFVVFEFNEPGMVRYGPTVVNRNTDPEDVIEELLDGRR